MEDAGRRGEDDWDSRLPARLFATDRYPSKRLNVYSKIEILLVVRDLLKDTPEWEPLKESCFGRLFELETSRCSVSCKLIHSLLTRQLVSKKKYSAWSVFGGQPFRFALEDFGAVTGLPCGEFPEEYDHEAHVLNKDIEESYWQKLFRLPRSATLADIVQEMREGKDMTGWRRMRLALLLIVDGVLVASAQTAKPTPKYVKMLQNIHEFLAFPWGRESFLWTLSSMKPGKKVPGKCDDPVGAYRQQLQQESLRLVGFPLALQLVAFEAIPMLATKLPQGKFHQKLVDFPGIKLHPKTVSLTDVLAIERSTNLVVKPITGGGLKDEEWDDEIRDRKVTYLEELIQSGHKFRKAEWSGGDASLPLLVDESKDIVGDKRKAKGRISSTVKKARVGEETPERCGSASIMGVELTLELLLEKVDSIVVEMKKVDLLTARVDELSGEVRKMNNRFGGRELRRRVKKAGGFVPPPGKVRRSSEQVKDPTNAQVADEVDGQESDGGVELRFSEPLTISLKDDVGVPQAWVDQAHCLSVVDRSEYVDYQGTMGGVNRGEDLVDPVVPTVTEGVGAKVDAGTDGLIAGLVEKENTVVDQDTLVENVSKDLGGVDPCVDNQAPVNVQECVKDITCDEFMDDQDISARVGCTPTFPMTQDRAIGGTAALHASGGDCMVEEYLREGLDDVVNVAREILSEHNETANLTVECKTRVVTDLSVEVRSAVGGEKSMTAAVTEYGLSERRTSPKNVDGHDSAIEGDGTEDEDGDEVDEVSDTESAVFGPYMPTPAEMELYGLMGNCMDDHGYVMLPTVGDSVYELFEKTLDEHRKVKHCTVGGYEIDNNFFLELSGSQKWVTTMHMEVLMSYIGERHSEMLRRQRLCFASPWLTINIQGKYRAFSKAYKKDLFGFDEKMKHHVRVAGQTWVDEVDTVYAPMIWGDSQWVGLCINLEMWSIEILDPMWNKSDEVVSEYMKPVVEMLPYIVRKLCPPRATQAHGVKPFTARRVGGLYTNKRTGDCGPVSAKFMELHAFGDSIEPGMEHITDSMVEAFRKQYSLDIFRDWVVPLYK